MIRVNKIASGTYGSALKSYVSKTDKTEVVVKRNFKDAETSFSGSIRELDLLNRLRGHPYIVKLLSVSFGNPFVAPNSPIPSKKGYAFEEDYLHFVMELGQQNFHNLIYEKVVHVSYLKLAMCQILLGLEYMHAKGVIHRDIKPANILWFVEDGKGTAKLCDFGMSKVHTSQAPNSPHICTCWFRSPEICARDENYSFASDMWSVGCVFYEMVARTALLVGSKDEDAKLISKIIGLLPNPSEEDIRKITRADTDNPIKLGKEAFPKYRKSWKEMIHPIPPNLEKHRAAELEKKKAADIAEFNKYPGEEASYDNFIDLLDGLLQLNPDKRLTATQALAHPFFRPYDNIIEWTRNNYPPVGKTEPMVEIISCLERKWATKLAFIIFNGRTTLPWYKHRIIFQSIDMFDRYLVYLKGINSEKTEKIETEYSGKYMSRYETQLRYVVCLYMSIKYYTTLSVPVSFTELATDEYKTQKALIEAEEFEKKMMRDILKFKIYRETVYEAADRKNIKLTELQVRDLLLHYGNSPSIPETSITKLLTNFLESTK